MFRFHIQLPQVYAVFPWYDLTVPTKPSSPIPWISDTVAASQTRLYQAETQARTRQADAQWGSERHSCF